MCGFCCFARPLVKVRDFAHQCQWEHQADPLGLQYIADFWTNNSYERSFALCPQEDSEGRVRCPARSRIFRPLSPIALRMTAKGGVRQAASLHSCVSF